MVVCFPCSMSMCARSCTPVCLPPTWTCQTHPHYRATLWPASSNHNYFVFPMTNFNICFTPLHVNESIIILYLKCLAVFIYKITWTPHYLYDLYAPWLLYMYEENFFTFRLSSFIRVCNAFSVFYLDSKTMLKTLGGSCSDITTKICSADFSILDGKSRKTDIKDYALECVSNGHLN